MKLSEFDPPRGTTIVQVAAILTSIEPGFRPPPRDASQMWDHLFVRFENTVELAEHGVQAVGAAVCKFLLSIDEDTGRREGVASN